MIPRLHSLVAGSLKLRYIPVRSSVHSLVHSFITNLVRLDCGDLPGIQHVRGEAELKACVRWRWTGGRSVDE